MPYIGIDYASILVSNKRRNKMKEYCGSCDLLVINGLKCHEFDCPDAWRDYERECKWCGTKFIPEEKDQDCCEISCSEAYYS